MTTEQHKKIWPALDRFQRVMALAERGLCVRGGLSVSTMHKLEPFIEQAIQGVGGVSPKEMDQVANRLQAIAENTARAAQQLREKARITRATLSRAQAVVDSICRQFSPHRAVAMQRRDSDGRISYDCAAVWKNDAPAKHIALARRYFQTRNIPVSEPLRDGETAIRWTIPTPE